MDYTVHGILQARILEWVAYPFSKGSSQPRDRTQVSRIAGRFFTMWVTREAPNIYIHAHTHIYVYTYYFYKWEIYIQVKKQQLELDMEQQTGSKSGKEYVKAVYCHPAYLTYVQSTSWEMLGWMKHKLESRLPGEISVMQIYR